MSNETSSLSTKPFTALPPENHRLPASYNVTIFSAKSARMSRVAFLVSTTSGAC